MWTWAVINKRTGKIEEEGFIFEKDAEALAKVMTTVYGEEFIVEMLP